MNQSRRSHFLLFQEATAGAYLAESYAKRAGFEFLLKERDQ